MMLACLTMIVISFVLLNMAFPVPIPIWLDYLRYSSEGMHAPHWETRNGLDDDFSLYSRPFENHRFNKSSSDEDFFEDDWDSFEQDGRRTLASPKRRNRRAGRRNGKNAPHGLLIILALLSVFTVSAVLIVVMLFQNRSRETELENYYVPVTEALVQKDAGTEYIGNQLIVISKAGVSKKEIESLLHAGGMSIVGYIELMDTYQVRLPESYSLDELSGIAESLQNDARIESAEPDIVWVPQLEDYRDDPWNEDGAPSHWDDGITGNNWGVKAINAPYCWDNYSLGPIYVGVIDSMFDPQHEDVRFAFLANNDIFYHYKSGEHDHNREHGTHVSGIIGAAHNTTGISGVVEDCFLYGFSKLGYTGVMDDLSAIAGFLASGIRVINYSYGYKEEIINDMVWKDIPLSPSRADYWKYYVNAGKEMETALKRLLDKDYDFLLVVSAGNQSWYNLPFTNMDAKWGSVFTYLSAPEIRERIIVVGAVQNDSGYYSIAPYSLRGERLDVMAPGTDIYSTIPENNSRNHYGKMSGTSQAAPHVTGVCASVWAAKPSLTGRDVKRIIVQTADIPVRGDCPNMVNMRAAMESVMRSGVSSTPAAQNQPVTAAIPTPSDQEDLFDESYWTFHFGQTLGSTFDALFHKDGSFTARSYGSGTYDDGTYTYNNGTLTINFWFTGSGCEFDGNADGFASRQKYPMQVGDDYYTIIPIEGESRVYYNGILGNASPSPVPSPSPLPQPQMAGASLSSLSDGEYYGMLTSWSDTTMTIEMLNYYGRYAQSYNYNLSSTGQSYTVDISQATVWLDGAWNNGNRAFAASINDALNTGIWGGQCKLQEACSMEIQFTVANSTVREIVFLYAA